MSRCTTVCVLILSGSWRYINIVGTTRSGDLADIEIVENALFNLVVVFSFFNFFIFIMSLIICCELLSITVIASEEKREEGEDCEYSHKSTPHTRIR